MEAEDWMRDHRALKGQIRSYTQGLPQDPYEQLEMATRAVFNSWFGKRPWITAMPPVSATTWARRQYPDRGLRNMARPAGRA